MRDQKHSFYSPLILHALFYRWPWRLLITVLSLASAVAGLASPYFQKLFVDQLTGTETWGLSYFDGGEAGLYFLVLAFVLFIIQQGLTLLASYAGSREGVELQRQLSEALYQHTLNLRTESLNQRPIGEVVSVYATDTQAAGMLLDNAVPMGANILFPLILAPLSIYWLFDIPLSYSVAVIFVLGLVNFMMAYRQSKFFKSFKELAAQRTGLVNEWVQNMRTLRILGWISSFEEKIFRKREEETINRLSMVTNGQFMNSVASSVTFALNILGLIVLINLRGNTVTPGELLAMLWIMGIFLTRPFRQMPWFFVFIFDALTSLRRIEAYLALANKPRRIDPEAKADPRGDQARIEVRGLTLEFADKKLLDNIDIEIEPGEFVAIVGEVGTGKSMLLLSLLGETSAHFETYRIDGQDVRYLHQEEVKKFYSYVPQEGFVMTASLRENVSFDYATSSDKDNELIQALATAQFDLEEESVSTGLSTEIGERGVNLSGGQRQRVNLARAQVHSAPVILMDDCLSAVDVETEEGLINDLITGYWGKKTRVLVTHRLSVLEKVDRILFLEQSKISASGSFNELVRTSPGFMRFVETLLREQKLRAEEDRGGVYA